jgi:hypothetical protein
MDSLPDKTNDKHVLREAVEQASLLACRAHTEVDIVGRGYQDDELVGMRFLRSKVKRGILQALLARSGLLSASERKFGFEINTDGSFWRSPLKACWAMYYTNFDA